MNHEYRARPPMSGPACEYFAPLLPLVGQQRLDPRDSSQLRQHLAACDYCQRELASYTWLDGALARHFGPAPRGPLSPADIREITSRAYRPRTPPPEPEPEPRGNQQRPEPPFHPTRPQPARRGRRLISILSAAAAVLIIAAVSLALFESRATPNKGRQIGTSAPTPTNTYIPRQQDTLSSVFMLSASEGWAVGATALSVSVSQNLILRFTGGQWKVERGPTNKDLDATSSELTQIDMLSASEGWAIGNLTPINSQTSVGSIFHYTAGRWMLQQTIANGNLRSFSMTSPTDGWAVGSSAENSSQLAHSLLLHYNGQTWTQVQAPGQQLTAIAMTSASNGWATGITHGGNGNPGSVVLHYNGNTWAPTTIRGIDTIVALSMRSASDGWAMGYKYLPQGRRQNIFAHYDGKTWTAVQTPITDNEEASVNSLFMDSSGDGWAVGHVVAGNPSAPTFTDLYLHYSGGQWTQVNGPNSGWPYSVFLLSASDGWAVGANGTIMRYQNGVWSITASAAPPTPTPTPTSTAGPASCTSHSGPTGAPNTPGATVTPVPFDQWSSYTNTTYHYELQYPTNWARDDLDCPDSSYLAFWNYDSQNWQGPGFPAGGIKIELYALDNPNVLSAMQFFQDEQQNQPGGPSCPAYTTRARKVGGHDAIEVTCPGQNNDDTYYISDGASMLRIAQGTGANASSDVLAQMVNNLTFTS